jgi:putative flippase GtrA
MKNKLNIIYRFLPSQEWQKHKKHIFKFSKFLFLWWLTYWINIWLTFLQVDVFWISKEISYFISIFLISVFNFFFSLKYTFNSKYSHKVLAKYTIFLWIFSLLNYISTNVITNFVWDKYLYFVIFLVTTFFFFMKFVVYDLFVFKVKI